MSHSRFQAGAYRTNITPPVGVCLAGVFHEVRAVDVLDELYANAVVLDDGGGEGEAAIVSVDNCAIPTDVYQDIAALVQNMSGIPEDRVVITATHTHAGPAIGLDLDGIYEVWPDYVGHFKRQVASAVRLAQLRKRDARLAAGKGHNRDYVFNRRLRRPDGTPVMNFIADKPGLLDCAPTGAVDSEVVVLRIEDAQGKPMAFLVNYCNHNNAMTDPLISADYAGVMGNHLKAVFGQDVIVLFLPGPAGNVNWIDSQDPNQWSPALYQKIGKSLAGTVLEIDARMEAIDPPTVRVERRKVPVRERPYRDYDMTVDGTFGRPEDNTDFWTAYRTAYERYKDAPLPVHEVDLRAITFGNSAALCTNPAELFAEYGLAIKAGSPFEYTLVAELTNGLVGYVPTPEAFDFGGYEVRKMPGTSYLATDAGERIVRGSLEILRRPTTDDGRQ